MKKATTPKLYDFSPRLVTWIDWLKEFEPYAVSGCQMCLSQVSEARTKNVCGLWTIGSVEFDIPWPAYENKS
jgi:hypothetical protein